MSERVVSRDDVQIATESFGDPAHPPALMMMGATASMLGWPEEFCTRLAATGRFVLRYDNRDTGRSTTGLPGQPTYSLDDLAEDAVAILDGYGLARTHLVGISLGGMIAQLVALKHPSRVASITAISSGRFDEDDPSLPEMDPALLEHFGKMSGLDWSDREAVVAFRVENFRISAGAAATFDATAAGHLAEREFDRAINPKSAMNHARLAGGEALGGRLGEIDVPFLVIHGRHDPILSLKHGIRLMEAVPNARMVVLEEAGHELNIRDWGRIIEAIRQHTAAPA